MGGCCAHPAATSPDVAANKYSVSQAPSPDSPACISGEAKAAAPSEPPSSVSQLALAVTPARVAPSGELQLQWNLPAGTTAQGDWLGLYEGAGADADTGCCVSSMVVSGAATGLIVLSAPAVAGRYHFRYFMAADGAAASVSECFRVEGKDRSCAVTPGYATGGVTIINEQMQSPAGMSPQPSVEMLTLPPSMNNKYHSIDYNRLENRRSTGMQLAPLSVEDQQLVGRRNSLEAKRVGGGSARSLRAQPVLEVRTAGHNSGSTSQSTDTSAPHSVHQLSGASWMGLQANVEGAQSPGATGVDGTQQWDSIHIPASTLEAAVDKKANLLTPLPSVTLDTVAAEDCHSTGAPSQGLEGPRSGDSVLSDGVDKILDEQMGSYASSDEISSTKNSSPYTVASPTSRGGQFNNSIETEQKAAARLSPQVVYTAENRAAAHMPIASLRSTKVYLEKSNRAEKATSQDTQTIPVPSANLTLKVANVTITNVSPEESCKPNQDRFLVDTCLKGDRDQHLFAVFDGHGPTGHDCAQFCRNNLSDALCSSAHFDSSVEKAYHAAFRQINMEMCVFAQLLGLGLGLRQYNMEL